LDDEAAQHVDHEGEVERLSAGLAYEFRHLAPESIEQAVRAGFERRSNARVTDFLPLFVERDVRRSLRAQADVRDAHPEATSNDTPAYDEP
jgi:hypothetical protein